MPPLIMPETTLLSFEFCVKVDEKFNFPRQLTNNLNRRFVKSWRSHGDALVEKLANGCNDFIHRLLLLVPFSISCLNTLPSE